MKHIPCDQTKFKEKHLSAKNLILGNISGEDVDTISAEFILERASKRWPSCLFFAFMNVIHVSFM